jgi:predicted DCC family thiol-disulfide oxidoreductase YuxK
MTTDESNLPNSDPTDIVLFDGQCGVCRAAARLLKLIDVGGRISLISLHDRSVANRFFAVDNARMMREMLVVDRFDRHYWGADAARYLSRRLPVLWPLMPILHMPGTRRLREFLYRKFATNRYRISALAGCASGTCSMTNEQSP